MCCLATTTKAPDCSYLIGVGEKHFWMLLTEISPRLHFQILLSSALSLSLLILLCLSKFLSIYPKEILFCIEFELFRL